MSLDKANRPPPDFYRVVRMWNGHREYASTADGWTRDRVYARSFPKLEAANVGRIASERIVPVRVTVHKVPRQHDFAWALRRMREGKRVRRVGWAQDPSTDWHHVLYAFIKPCGNLFTADAHTHAMNSLRHFDLTATDWELAP